MKKKLIMLHCALCIVHFAFSQESPRMQWFKDAKLGIFIHWGIYAVNGIDESWSFFNEKVTYEDYMKQKEGFTAAGYNADHWAQLIKESGAKYAVLTSKHHDGMALWDTKMSDLNVVRQTPASRDLVGPFCKALRAKGLRVGLYYSLLDWSHPDYPNFTRGQQRYNRDSIPSRWEQFVRFNMGQIAEVMTKFNPDLFWFDGDWEQSAEQWQAKEIREMLLENNPNVIINSRLQGYGDYATPEQGIPVARPKDQYWELCMTMNDSWGFQPLDTNYKSVNLIIRIFADVISNGGNLLLDIGPKADGTIPDEQVSILEGLGRWTEEHAEAIYGTLPGLPKDCFYGPTTLSADSTIIYLFIANHKSQINIDTSIHRYIDTSTNSLTVLQSHSPTVTPSCSPTVLLKGILTPISSVTVIGSGVALSHKTWLKPWWSSHAGLIEIKLPAELMDEEMTVVAVKLDGTLRLEF